MLSLYLQRVERVTQKQRTKLSTENVSNCHLAVISSCVLTLSRIDLSPNNAEE